MKTIRDFIPRPTARAAYGTGTGKVSFHVSYNDTAGHRQVQKVTYVRAAVGDFKGEVDNVVSSRRRSKKIRAAVGAAMVELGMERQDQFNQEVTLLSRKLRCGKSFAMIAATRWFLAQEVPHAEE